MSAVLNDQRLASQTQGVEFILCVVYIVHFSKYYVISGVVVWVVWL